MYVCVCVCVSVCVCVCMCVCLRARVRACVHALQKWDMVLCSLQSIGPFQEGDCESYNDRTLNVTWIELYKSLI